MPTSMPNFNFLALLVSERKRMSQNLMWGLPAPCRTPYAKTFMCAQSTWQGKKACQISASYLYASCSYANMYFPYMSCVCLGKQELSYRQQIARQLRTQYAEGIYRHKYYTVTLKSRLRVTQGHWKQNHWIDRSYMT